MERFIRPMAPGWFASVMGTAVTSLALTLASHAAADAGPALAAPVALAASALHWLAIAMMSVLGIAAVYRLIRHSCATPSRGASMRPSRSRCWLWRPSGRSAGSRPP